LALAISGVAVGIQYVVLMFADIPALGLLYPTTYFIAWYLGFAPAVTAIATCTVAGFYLFNLPHFSFLGRDVSALIRYGIFIVTSLFIARVIARGRLNELRLAELQSRFQKVSAATHLGIWYCDLPLDKLSWNAESKAQFGLPADADVTLDVFKSRVHPEDLDRVMASVQHSIDHRALYDIQFRVIDPSAPSRVKWLHAIGWTDYEASGAPKSFDGIALDITQLKRAAEDRDQALAETREALRTRDEFMSIASHELKTPLTSLHLQLQLIARTVKKAGGAGTASDELSQRILSSIANGERQSTRLAQLLDELLDLTRVRLGRLQLTKEEVDLAQIAREVVERFAGQTQAMGYAVRFEAAPEVTGHWDRTRIEQIVTNVFSNAIKYGEGKPITVSIARDELRSGATIRIHDQGMGIEPTMRERIFERFERAVSSQNISGLGLGLYITRQIVEAHGGSIQVESQPGQGSTFIVRLPFRHDETAPLTTDLDPVRESGTSARLPG
jgi:signal transduction histidine kinase